MFIPNFPAFPGGAPQIQWGDLNPELDYAQPPLVDMLVGSIYLALQGTFDTCGWAATAACLWYKQTDSANAACPAPGSAKDWVRVLCPKLFTGDGQPDEEVSCAESQVYDFYAILDENGCAVRLWMKWQDGCNGCDWFELCPPQSAHPPAQLTFTPGQPYGWDAALQQGNIPPLRISKQQDLARATLDTATYTLNLPPAIAARRQVSYPQQVYLPQGVFQPLAALNEVALDTTAAIGQPMAPATPDDALVIRKTGAYDLAASVGVEDPAGGYSLMVRLTINGVLAGGQIGPKPVGAAIAPVLLLPNQPLNVGDRIGVAAWTDAADGLFIDAAWVSATYIEGT